MESSGKLRVVIVTAAVTAVLTTVANKVGDSLFPPPPQVIVREGSPSIHLGRLREDYPPLVFSVSYYGFIKEQRYGLLGLAKVPKQWVYDLKLANLSETPVSRIEITVRFPIDVHWFQLREPKGLLDCDFEEFSDYKDLVSGRHAGKYAFAVKKLEPGNGRSIRFHLYSDERVLSEKLELSIVCAEGPFVNITPIQYERIGWKEGP